MTSNLLFPNLQIPLQILLLVFSRCIWPVYYPVLYKQLQSRSCFDAMLCYIGISLNITASTVSSISVSFSLRFIGNFNSFAFCLTFYTFICCYFWYKLIYLCNGFIRINAFSLQLSRFVQSCCTYSACFAIYMFFYVSKTFCLFLYYLFYGVYLQVAS